MPALRGDRHECPAPAAHHVRDGELRQPQRPVQPDLELPFEGGRRLVDDAGLDTGPDEFDRGRIIDHDVQAAELRHGPVDERLHVRFVGDVTFDEHG